MNDDSNNLKQRHPDHDLIEDIRWAVASYASAVIGRAGWPKDEHRKIARKVARLLKRELEGKNVEREAHVRGDAAE